MVFRNALFWDTDPALLDEEKHSSYIIERITNFGNDEDVAWLRKRYPKNRLLEVSQNSKGLMPSARTLWLLILNH